MQYLKVGLLSGVLGKIKVLKTVTVQMQRRMEYFGDEFVVRP